MGGEDQALGHAAQGRIGRQGLLGVHVQGSAADHAVLHGLGQGRFIHDAAAGTVDDAGRGLHGRQQLGVDQVFGLGGAGQVQADVVGLGEEGRQGHEAHLQLLGPLRRDERVVGHHIHAHGLGNPGHMGADLAQAHHAQLFLVELVAHIGLAVPAAGHGAGVGVGHVARQRQHQGQGVLGRGDRVALGRIHHDHAPLGGGRHIHVVDTNAGAANDAQLGGGLDDVGGHLGAGADHQGVVLADDRLELCRRQAGAHIHLGHLGEDVDPRLIDGIGNQNLCHDPAGGELPGASVERRRWGPQPDPQRPPQRPVGQPLAAPADRGESGFFIGADPWRTAWWRSWPPMTSCRRCAASWPN